MGQGKGEPPAFNMERPTRSPEQAMINRRSLRERRAENGTGKERRTLSLNLQHSTWNVQPGARSRQ
jgi:hypothetical protein